MEPNWLRWLHENMPDDLQTEFKNEWAHNANWRDELITRLRAENSRLVTRVVAHLALPIEVLVGLDEAKPYDILSPDLRQKFQQARSTVREIAAEWLVGYAAPHG